MGKRRLWKVSVAISGEAEDAVGELLERLFRQPVSIHVDARTNATVASVFLADAKALASDKLEELKAGLRVIRGFGIQLGSGRIRIQEVKPENWAESWKRHFPPLVIGGKLLVKPPWSKLRAKKEQRVIVLNPGLSFGTGQHPTTRFCLEELVRQRRTLQPQSCLDLGSGSGILGIAAAKLGYDRVVGVDNDPLAVKIAKRNAAKNRVKVTFHCLDLTDSGNTGWRVIRRARPTVYDLVCANLIFDLLLAERHRISASVKPGGVLVLAGILKGQFPAVREAYEKLGLTLDRTRGTTEWRSGAFTHKRVN